MTEEEKVFAGLMKQFDEAAANLKDATEKLGRTPEFVSGGGTYTPDGIAAFRAEESAYNARAERLTASKTALQEATAALDDYLPASLRSRMDAGVAVFTAAPVGVGALRRYRGEYITFYAANDQSLDHRLRSFVG